MRATRVRRSSISRTRSASRTQCRPSARLTTRLLLNVGNTYVRTRDMVNATRFYRAALTYALNSKDRIAEGYATILLGLCALESRGADPVRESRSGLELFESLGYARGAAFAQAALGKIAERNRQLVQATDRYRRAIALQEQWLSNPPEQDVYTRCEAAFFPEGSTYAYDQLLDVLLRTGETGEAFWFAERKSRSLYLRMLAGTEPAVKDSGAAAIIETARRFRARRIAAEAQYATAPCDGGGADPGCQAGPSSGSRPRGRRPLRCAMRRREGGLRLRLSSVLMESGWRMCSVGSVPARRSSGMCPTSRTPVCFCRHARRSFSCASRPSGANR